MLGRISRSKEGFADYLITGKRADSPYSRNEKDKVVPLHGNLNIFKKTEIYLNKFKNYKDNYLHLTLSFSQSDTDKLNQIKDEEKRDELLRELVLIYIKHHTSGYNIENEVIAYAEAHFPKIQQNEKNMQRFPHIHIGIAKYNPLDDTNLKTTFFNNSFMDDVLQSFVNKKYDFEIPRKDDKLKIANNSNESNNLIKNIKSKIGIKRAQWQELLKDIKTSDDLLHFLQNDLNLVENIDYKIAGSKSYKYIKILNLQERNGKFESLNLQGKDFQRFILKNDTNRTFPRNKPILELEDILSSFYKKRIDDIYIRKSQKTKELLNDIHQKEENKIPSNQNSFKYQTYQQKLFNTHYDYLIEDKLKGYYISKKNNEVIIKNQSLNIEIIDKGDEIISDSNSKNIEEKVKLMIEISLAKKWKLENIEVQGTQEFIIEANKQIASLILKNLKLEEKEKENLNKKENKKKITPIQRATTYTQKLNQNIEEKEETKEIEKNIDIKTLKEKLNAKLVLDYAVAHYKLDITNYKLTPDNKIDNLNNKQKPKNIIDFFQKELNLSTKEAIEICNIIYENHENQESNNESVNKKIQIRTSMKDRK